MKKKRWMPLWVLPVFIVLAVGTVWLRLAVVRTTYQISEADKATRNLMQERQQIDLRVAGLRSPRRLESLARARYGLSQPTSDQVVHLSVEQKTEKSGERRSPSGSQK